MWVERVLFSVFYAIGYNYELRWNIYNQFGQFDQRTMRITEQGRRSSPLRVHNVLLIMNTNEVTWLSVRS